MLGDIRRSIWRSCVSWTSRLLTLLVASPLVSKAKQRWQNIQNMVLHCRCLAWLRWKRGYRAAGRWEAGSRGGRQSLCLARQQMHAKKQQAVLFHAVLLHHHKETLRHALRYKCAYYIWLIFFDEIRSDRTCLARKSDEFSSPPDIPRTSVQRKQP